MDRWINAENTNLLCVNMLHMCYICCVFRKEDRQNNIESQQRESEGITNELVAIEINNITPATPNSTTTRINEEELSLPCQSVKVHRESPSTPYNPSLDQFTRSILHSFLLFLFYCVSRGRGAVLTVLKHVLRQSSISSSRCIFATFLWASFLPQVSASSFVNGTSEETSTCEADPHMPNTTVMHRSAIFTGD